MNENEREEREVYKTTNFHISVWLQMNGARLIDVDWQNKRRANFVFDYFDGIDSLVSDFFKQEVIQNYISISQETKARMYSVNPPVEYERT